MQKLLYILFCITLISCNSKTQEVKKEEVVVFQKEIDLGISDEEIYSVINTHLEREIKTYKEFSLQGINYISFSIFIKNGEDENDYDYFGIPSFIEKDSLFTNEDLEFVKIQIKQTEVFDLNQKYISDFKVVHKDTFSNLLENANRVSYGKIIREKYGNMSWISLPLFSKNKELAIVNYDYNCGSLCGHSRTSMYKKQNGKWIWLKDISYSVS